VERFERSFFTRDARRVARALLGARLVHAAEGGDLVGIVVETEAYRGPDDRACHARFGRTEARRHLFARPGTAYLFRVYGMHLCFNVTCLAEGAGHAVLIRGIEISGGRGSGPGLVTRALGLGLEHGGIDLVSDDAVHFAVGERPPGRVIVTPRVGVAYAGEHAEAPLRFFVEGSPGVSRPPAASVGRGRGR
jgi:DNA-3-methyladenine glycosylase